MLIESVIFFNDFRCPYSYRLLFDRKFTALLNIYVFRRYEDAEEQRADY